MKMPAAVVLADRGFFAVGPIDLLEPMDQEVVARSASIRASLSPATLTEPELLPWQPPAAIGEPSCSSF
jgi:hypothetical protein